MCKKQQFHNGGLEFVNKMQILTFQSRLLKQSPKEYF